MPTRDLLLLIIKRKYLNVDLSLLRTFTFCSSFYVIILCLCQLLRIPIITKLSIY